MTNLTELWLGKNKITQLDGLDTLVNLRLLSIQSNRIVKLEGLDKLSKLEELYISHNGLKELSGLEHNVRGHLVASWADRAAAQPPRARRQQQRSRTHCQHLASQSAHRVLGPSRLAAMALISQASNNQLAEFADVESQLAGLAALDTVYLEGNPLQRDLGTAYRRRVMLALPQLKQIDATCVAALRAWLTKQLRAAVLRG